MVGSATYALADSPIKLFVNGAEIKSDVALQMVNDRTLVPIRAVSEALGADVQWNGDTNSVSVKTHRTLPYHYAILPDGTGFISTGNAQKWKDISATLYVVDTPPNSTDVLAVIGNHVEILKQESLKVADGPATLVTVDRSGPAADPNPAKPTREYWLIQFKDSKAYAVQAIVVGTDSAALEEVRQISSAWKIGQTE